MCDKKPMATKCSKAELDLIQLRRRRATKVAELVEQMGVKCITHPDNKTQWRSWP